VMSVDRTASVPCVDGNGWISLVDLLLKQRSVNVWNVIIRLRGTLKRTLNEFCQRTIDNTGARLGW
jgi:hypothetical protein